MPAAIFFPQDVTLEEIAERARKTGLKPYLFRGHSSALLERPLPGWVPLGVFCKDVALKQPKGGA